MRTALLVLALAVTAALVGCTAQASTPPGPVETAQVIMPKSYRFDPVAIQVPAGTTVTWANQDNFTHSVSVTTGGFPLLSLSPGQSGSMTFNDPGEYNYICTYHAQNMKGKVVVVAR
ncbi:MAG: cupredoxin domain-containing protein [Chloroflexi bacterium]|nr:cupredoxin domain-containing protein [Chloroflexota bacterium]